MSRNLNRVSLIGRLGADPEVRYLPNGTACVSINIAVGDDYKDKDGNKVERTEWVRLSAFGKLAEIIGEYLKKGSKIYAEGKYTTRQWEKDGVKQYSTEVQLLSMEMLDSSGDGGKQNSRPSEPPAHNQAPPDMAAYDDDIPF